MDDTYQYRADTLVQGGYDGESYGVIPPVVNWTTTSDLTGEKTYQYFYRDSNRGANASDADSSRVVVTVKDSWTVEISQFNTLIVNVTTDVLSVVRDDIRGNPTVGRDYLRRIMFRHSLNGTTLKQFNNLSINSPSTISGPFSLGSQTFLLSPGEDAQRSTLYVLNQTQGFENLPIPNQYTDEIQIGIRFRNILPADYIPGAVLSNNTWLSHNRSGGNNAIWNGISWATMRTEDGGVASNNPPLIYTPSGFKNQQRTGQE